MTTHSTTITDLPETLQIDNTYYLVTVDTIANTTKKVSIGTVFTNSQLTIIAGKLIITPGATPANNSSVTATPGTIFSDGSYLYVATSNNYLKRVALNAF